MSLLRFAAARQALIVCATLTFAAVTGTPKVYGAFHLWALQEVYTNSSGSLQFIEMFDQYGGQQYVTGQQISVSSGSTTHTYTIGSEPADDSYNHTLLFGTAGLQAAGGPKPDYFLPDGFLFAGGGTINFFGYNSGTYTALPTDGNLSRTWGTNNNAVNSPQNFTGEAGHVVVPQDTLGDFNRDGHINRADIQPMLSALTDLRAYQTSQDLSNAGLLAIGDLDKNNAVTNADLQQLLVKLKTGGGSGISTVPEPTSGLLCGTALVGLLLAGRKFAARRSGS